MSLLRRRCPLGFHAHRDEVASSVLCLWGGDVFDLPEAGFPARAIVVCWGCPGLAMRDSSSRSVPCFVHWWVCAPEFNLVGARMRAPKQTWLGSVYLPGDARRTHVRRSRHLPFYDPKVEGRQVTRV
ncbi:hypothetical protein CRG98_033346 [Punica granatum]|uniref:Uncharacterized protein n=1 Tax=Punica granatum TaxID=22663 RepID=A0A2I0IRF8_PUNGR|nr:hypothetical protein CRG98_033346 [Punica granatum]